MASQCALQVPQPHEVPWPAVLGASIKVSPGTPPACDTKLTGVWKPLATGIDDSDDSSLSKTAGLTDAMGVYPRMSQGCLGSGEPVPPSKETKADTVAIGRATIDRSDVGGGIGLMPSDAAKLIGVIGKQPACETGKPTAHMTPRQGNKAKRQITKTPVQAVQGGLHGGGKPDVRNMKMKLRAQKWAAGGSDIGSCTTVMIRHVPYKYPRQKLLNDIDDAGFKGLYDFFYLPSANRKCSNRGFAFVNFVREEVAESFYRKFDGMRLCYNNSANLVSVMPADVQGFDANVEHYANSCDENTTRDVLQYKPIFFRPLPADPGQTKLTGCTWCQ